MKTLVRQALNVAPLFPPMISMEEEINAVVDAEDSRVKATTELEEAERALDVNDALEDLAFVADSIKVATPREAALIQIVADTAVAGTGVDGSTIAPAMEDDEVAPQGNKIREIIKKIVEAIKAAIASVMKHIDNFFSDIFKTVGNVKGRIEALKLRSKSVKDSEALGMIASKGLVSGDKYLTTPNDIARGLKKYDSDLSRFVVENGEYAYAVGSALVKFYKLVEGGDAKPEALSSVLAPALNTRIPRRDDAPLELLGGLAISNGHLPPHIEMTTVKTLEFIVTKKAILVQSSGKDLPTPTAFKAFTVKQVQDALNDLDGLVLHLSDRADKAYLGVAAKSRAEFAKMVSDEIAKAVATFPASKEGEESSTLSYVNLAPKASTFFTGISTSGYTALLSNTLRVVNATVSILAQSLDAAVAPPKKAAA